MSPHQIVAVGVRLFAIWLAIYVARSTPRFMLEAQKYNDDFALMFAGGIAFVVTVLILALLFFPQFFARGLLAGQGNASQPTGPDRWFDVGCSLIGLWVLTDAVPGLVRYVIVNYLVRRDPTVIPLTPDWHAGAIYYLIEFFIGLWLFLGAVGLKRLVFWARYAATK